MSLVGGVTGGGLGVIGWASGVGGGFGVTGGPGGGIGVVGGGGGGGLGPEHMLGQVPVPSGMVNAHVRSFIFCASVPPHAYTLLKHRTCCEAHPLAVMA